MRETWYVLEDDSVANPNEVAPDDAGVLRHKGGKAVAMGEFGPLSRGVDVDEAFGGKGDHDGNGKAGGAKKTAEPEKPKAGYKTRESKGQ